MREEKSLECRSTQDHGFEKKSQFNDKRDSYVDANGNYVYTEWVKVGKKWERRVVATIPLDAENRDFIIMLDGSDHDMDLGDRYEEEHTDYSVENQKAKQAEPDGGTSEDQDFDADPIENIADPHGDAFQQLYPEEEPVNPMVQKAETFISEELKPAQQDMVYGHLGECKYLEDLRREENARTGKNMKKAGYHDRWDRIIQKGCKYFGVEKQKQSKRKQK